MQSKNSLEFLKYNDPNVMAVALCEIILDNLGNNMADNYGKYSAEILEIEAIIKGLNTAGSILCKDYSTNLMELRGIIMEEFHLNDRKQEVETRKKRGKNYT